MGILNIRNNWIKPVPGLVWCGFNKEGNPNLENNFGAFALEKRERKKKPLN